MVPGAKEVAPQRQGVVGHPFRLEALCGSSHKQNHGDSFGKHHGSLIHQEAGWNALVLPVRGGKRTAYLGGPETGQDYHKIYPREDECPGR